MVMKLLAALAGLLLILAPVRTSAQSYCDDLEIPPCALQVPRDIIFLVDASKSMDVDRFYADVLNYTLQLFCAFDEEQGSKAGMVIFAEQVKVQIPLQQWTRNQWYNKVTEVKDSRYGPEPVCCSCCTPTADAFQVANAEFDRRAKNDVQLAFVLTDGVPSNNNPDTGGDPAYWFYDPATGYDPSLYATQAVPDEAWAVKNAGRRIILVGVPNYLGVPPDKKYFNGGYNNGKNYCTKRQGVNFCTKYFTKNEPQPNFPLVSLPVSKNSFSQNNWGDNELLLEIVDALCFVPPTAAPTPKPTMKPTKKPTSKAPTKKPTLAPTKYPTDKPVSEYPTKQPTGFPTTQPTSSPVKPALEQIDVTFLMDRSNSMTYHPTLCQNVLDTFPESNRPVASEPCWQLWTRFVENQAKDFARLDAGANNDRKMGWRSDYGDGSVPAKGLRVRVIGFACTNKQKTPLLFDYSNDYFNGASITSEAQLIELLNFLRTNVTPFGGTCPHLAVEQAVKHLEATDPELYPLQSVILMTDGVFYDGSATPRATKGLDAYRALTYAVGVAVAQDGQKFGMTPEEIETQRKQLTKFVNGDANYFYNIKNGYDGLLDITLTVADSLPSYFFSKAGNPPIERYTWCGFKRKHNCASNNYRKQHCKWRGTRKASYKCRRK